MREFFPHLLANRAEPRPMAPPPEEAPNEYPYTLDLRRKANWIG
jgi:hypothetical protein